MGINLGNRADPQLAGFATADTTGVSIIWGDFYPVPIDGMKLAAYGDHFVSQPGVTVAIK